MDPPAGEPTDIVERRPLDVLHVAPGTRTVVQFGLVETIEALGEGVLVAGTRGAD